MTDLDPEACPRCGRKAHFRYSNHEEAARRSPLCWGESDADCPGYNEDNMSNSDLPTTERNGQWATVTLNEATAGKGWFVMRTVGITRYAELDRARDRARKWAGAGRRAAVIPWGDDLSNGLGASPENANIARVIEALALKTHEPLFEADGEGPEAMPTGRFVGCACGAMHDPLVWKGDGEALYLAHVAEVFKDSVERWDLAEGGVERFPLITGGTK